MLKSNHQENPCWRLTPHSLHCLKVVRVEGVFGMDGRHGAELRPRALDKLEMLDAFPKSTVESLCSLKE